MSYELKTVSLRQTSSKDYSIPWA